MWYEYCGLWMSYYSSSHGYVSNNRECIIVSWFYSYITYRDIGKNGLHVVTHEENNEEFLHIIKKNGDGHDILERISSLLFRLYYTYIKSVPHVAYKVIFQNVDAFTTWHERLGLPGVGIMRKIIGNSTDHNLNSPKFPKSLNFMCPACAT
jgi:hypothetical protein